MIVKKSFDRTIKLLPLIIGCLAFFLLVGPRALNPFNIVWLGHGDPATHYLGWLFFQNSEWSFPIGMNPKYGLELSNAIVFSDSIPLLAFFFKCFSNFLPEAFNYFGIWLMMCFVLQAWFGWKLTGLISRVNSIRILGAVFFIFAPPMLMRLSGHFSLVGHFLILASLYLALCPELSHRKLSWGILLIVSALVHAYFLAMVGILWLADLFGKVITRRLQISKVSSELIILLLIIFITCWQAGYFSVLKSVSDGQYGFYRINLLSLINPIGWSYILNDIPQAAGEYEGFNFLGSGVILLLFFALPGLIDKKTTVFHALCKFPVILIALICMSAFSISNNIGIGPYEFSYDIPDKIVTLASVFRSSGRFFWPVFYMIILFIFFVIARSYKKRTVQFLLVLAVVFQIVDNGGAYKRLRHQLMIKRSSAWSSPLVDPFWDHAALKYAKIRWIQTANHSQHWRTIAYYAGTHGLSTDAVYLARVDIEALIKTVNKENEKIKTGRYENDTLYFLEDPALQKAKTSLNPDCDLLAQIDGFNILAPGWYKCIDCP